MPKASPCPSPCHVLLIGGGGREHALAWKLKQSPRLGDLWLSDGVSAPANAGLLALGKPCPIPMDGRDAFRMQRWCEVNHIDLVVIGPEGPLAAGVADALAVRPTPARQASHPRPRRKLNPTRRSANN